MLSRNSFLSVSCVNPRSKPPHAFRIPLVSILPCLRISSSKNRPCPRNSEKPSVVWYGYFLESPNTPKIITLQFQRKALRCVNKTFVERIERGEREHLKISGKKNGNMYSCNLFSIFSCFISIITIIHPRLKIHHHILYHCKYAGGCKL